MSAYFQSVPFDPAAQSPVSQRADANGARPVAPRSNATLALHGPDARSSSHSTRPAAKPRRNTGPLVQGIVQSTTYLHSAVGECDGPTYSRVGNPSVDGLEEVLGGLENALPSVCFATGLAAETALFLSLLRAGDHAVVGEAIYGGTVRLFRQVLAPLGIDCTFVDSTDASNIARAITPRTKLVFIETPANPTLTLTDIAAVAAITREAGVPLAVDNTFLTPVLQRPLDLGAQISVYSTTKHIDGHSVALGGAITTRDETLIEHLRFIRKATGNIQAPFNAWLTTQGIKTLPLRIERHSRSALTVARWLRSQIGDGLHTSEGGSVARVYYPGLHDSPQRDLAQRQHLGGHGGVVTFELRGGFEAGKTLMNSVRLCRLVEHIGSVETLITHPASMTHGDVPREQRERARITDGLVRLSVGLEEPAEIIDDLAQAIDTAVREQASKSSRRQVAPVSAGVRTKGGVACLSSN